ncbi:MAG TPA: S16 family serine protease [Plantibacter sp.]|uniref:YlbL family protein n=1 Tax=Plantibacter sp. TaxID=1871045 RepID=UPI002CD7FC59|nr:S16 family serine protease [Plantibacter sp.]
MSLFADEAPTASETSDPSRRGRARFGWIVLVLSLVLLGVLSVVPAPYVIEQPGPVFNVLGTTEGDDGDVPLIEVHDTQTYDTGGTLDMLTVQLVGNPQRSPGWLDIVSAWFDPSRAVVPMDLYFPPGVTTEQRDEQNATLMVDSQQDSVAAALRQLGYEVPEHVAVAQIAEGSPAQGVLELDDEIVAVNGAAVTGLDGLRTAISDNGTAAPASFDIVRGGVASTVDITPTTATATDGTTSTVIGIGTKVSYDLPVDITIQLDNVGGPSAGMVFALGMIDLLTPGELNGGQDVAGTGTIDADGNVGAIGGIRQKLFGAKDAGADWFLAPASNCDEVVGHVPDGLTVFAVKTLDDSLAALDAIADGGDTSALPTCKTG